MASNLKNLSDHDPASIPDGSTMKFGIVVAEWNEEITAALLEGCMNSLGNHGVKKENIQVKTVPGSFELPFGARVVAEKFSPHAVICLGCVIQGETRHFDFICQGVTGLHQFDPFYRRGVSVLYVDGTAGDPIFEYFFQGQSHGGRRLSGAHYENPVKFGQIYHRLADVQAIAFAPAVSFDRRRRFDGLNTR